MCPSGEKFVEVCLKPNIKDQGLLISGFFSCEAKPQHLKFLPASAITLMRLGSRRYLWKATVLTTIPPTPEGIFENMKPMLAGVLDIIKPPSLCLTSLMSSASIHEIVEG